MFDIGKSSLWITEHPESQYSVTQDCHPVVLAKTRRQPTILGRIVKHEGAIEMRPAFCNVARGE
jgi:hypothetical protein